MGPSYDDMRNSFPEGTMVTAPGEPLDPKDERLLWQAQVIGELKAQAQAADMRAHREERRNNELEKEVSQLRDEIKEERDNRNGWRERAQEAELKLSKRRTK